MSDWQLHGRTLNVPGSGTHPDPLQTSQVVTTVSTAG
jgi:hypothetical protein